MSKPGGKFKEIGSILASKSPKRASSKFYIKFNEDVTYRAGDTVQVVDPRLSLDEAVEAGRMSEEKAEEIKGKLPDFVRFRLLDTNADKR